MAQWDAFIGYFVYEPPRSIYEGYPDYFQTEERPAIKSDPIEATLAAMHRSPLGDHTLQDEAEGIDQEVYLHRRWPRMVADWVADGGNPEDPVAFELFCDETSRERQRYGTYK